MITVQTKIMQRKEKLSFFNPIWNSLSTNFYPFLHQMTSQLKIQAFKLWKFSDQSQSVGRHLRTAVEVEWPQLEGVVGKGQEALVRDGNTLPNIQFFEVSQSLGQPLQSFVANGTSCQRQGPEGGDARGDVLHAGVGDVGTEGNVKGSKLESVFGQKSYSNVADVITWT